jgi:hypothetical protein
LSASANTIAQLVHGNRVKHDEAFCAGFVGVVNN